MNENYRGHNAGKYDGLDGEEDTSVKFDPNAMNVDNRPPPEKGKFLNAVEKHTVAGSGAGKLRDKTRRELEKLGLD